MEVNMNIPVSVFFLIFKRLKILVHIPIVSEYLHCLSFVSMYCSCLY